MSASARTKHLVFLRGEKRFVSTVENNTRQVLAGVRVLELGQLIAGPFCAKTLADFGAEVIKIEPPEHGDPLRKWRLLKDGESVWWQVQSRNKQSVTIDLRTEEGQALVRLLAVEADILIENFKPGTLESWGLGWDQLSASNPSLVMVRFSGFGQDGPCRDLPGFGAIAEAMGGLRYLTGEPGRVPVRTGISIGDTLAALHGTIGALLALYDRKVNGGKGQVIDVALYESVFNCMESLLPEYSAFGVVREPSGSALPGISPSNAYRCSDGTLLIAGNGDSIYKRLMNLIDRSDLAQRPELAQNDGRTQHVAEIDAAITEWTAKQTVAGALAALSLVQVPASRIFTAKDIAEDPQYKARGMIQRITTRAGYEIDVPGIVPKLSMTPGAIRSPAPALGENTDAVLGEIGVSAERLAALVNAKIV
jgi:formyl-CoA transferase